MKERKRIMKGNEKPQTWLKERLLKKMPTILPVLFLCVLVSLIIGLSGTIKAEKARMTVEKMEAISKERPAANVVLLDVAPTTIHDRINLPGVIEPWEELSVLAKVQGTVIKMEVSEGDKVAKGQVIARLDPDDFRIALDSVRATFELAAADQKRFAILYKKGSISLAKLEKFEAQVKTSRAALENAELMLSRCAIKAPISGVIRRLDAKEGLLLNVYDPVAEILQIDKVKAVVGIPESDVALVRDIKNVNLTIQALNNKEVVGRAHFLASSPENDARLYRLELAIDNNDNQILPGMFFRAQLIKKTFKDTVSVPLYTVIKRENRQFVYVEENGVAQRKPVELGIIEDWRVQITKGLSHGSRVVVEGHRDIDDGHKLKIVRVLSDPAEALL
jgi:membrane fusion protein (multidrug efflux system)